MNKTTNVTKLLNRLVETKAETIKLGMDLHARDVVVCVQVDGALPQRPQKMTTAELLVLVRGLVAAGRKVYCCYETGAVTDCTARCWRLTRSVTLWWRRRSATGGGKRPTTLTRRR
jgi:hypothetical protein